ncbi:MAG: hypothetical protein IJ302_05770 [Clostridia bacterium]|nr:hypothetical protein [Clostridia bacterium]
MKSRMIASCSLMAVLLTLIVSCSDSADLGTVSGSDTTPSADSVAETTAGTELPAMKPLPEADFGGMTFRISNNDPAAFSWSHILTEADEDGTPVNDAIHLRNAKLEETYNFTLETTYQKDFGTGYVNTFVLAGEDAYDICLLYDINAASVIDVLQPWNDLPYIDVTEAWWNPAATEYFNIGGRQYLTAGNMTLTYISRAMCYLFNKNIYAALGFDENLYDMVLDGKWTLDVFHRMAAEAVSDLNGDGAYDENDRYGVFGNPRAYYNTQFAGADIRYVERENDGTYVFRMQENTAAIDMIEKLLAFDAANPNLSYNTGRAAHELIPDTLFESGQALFNVGGLPHTIEQLRSMEDEFGILPLPKADEAQAEYHTTAYGGVLSALPKTVPEERFEAIGLILEAMTRDTYTEIVPLYKEVLLKTKYSRDAESSEMLDIIFSTIQFDPGIVLWCSSISDVICTDLFMKGNNAVVSFFEKKKPVFDKLLNDFNDTVE